VIYDQIWVYERSVFSKTLFFNRNADVPYCFALSRAAGRDGATRRDHPSQGHGSSPAALNQMPRCTADECASIVPGQFFFGPDLMLSYQPRVPAPQRVMLHPHQLHISTSRELLAYPWWPCASTRTVTPQESNQKPSRSRMIERTVCIASAATAPVCMHLWAGTVSISASVAASQAPGLWSQLIKQAL
jgi:hypothetical protein